jgi:osmotically inducible protein OsmC
MALSAGLTAAGHTPTRIQTTATVHIEPMDGGFTISKIELTTHGAVPGIDEETFRKYAEEAKKGCPVSKALASVPSITLIASLD